ncbi:MAG: peptide ABC transporter substrate-binding protein [bacterium]|nr:peptide ABC transporter substrate-binding protein [bacterium]
MEIPRFNSAEKIVKKFSLSERLFFYALLIVGISASFVLLLKVNNAFLIEIPTRGGSLTEGVVGFPRFINPLLAVSDADRDLVALVYSGLMKASHTGELVLDLAEKYEISEDGLTYAFTLKEDAKFHDGEPVTAEDVLFTIKKAQDPNLKSPKRADWEGVQAEAVGEKTIRFTLKQPYSPFLENTTLGILPKHVWQNADSELFPFSEYNTEPIGSGPYKIKKIKRNDSLIPIAYELAPFEHYTFGKPFIEKIIIRFYANEVKLLEGYSQGDVESITTIAPADAKRLEKSGTRVEKTTLPRVFGVFFNQNQAPIFTHKEVREALNLAVDKRKIVEEVLSGYGQEISSPVPSDLSGKSRSGEELTSEEKFSKAEQLLAEHGWEMNEETMILEKTENKKQIPLEFTLVTSTVPELRQTATLLQDMWKKLGVEVRLQFFETSELNQNIIRPRKYDALLFGEIVGRDLDLFAFWHSSQRNDPGLNISLYANITADKALEEIRATSDKGKKLEKYLTFEKEIMKDVPAVFTYSPEFLYVVPQKIKGFDLGRIAIPSERFLEINNWYVETEKVWKVFVR